MYFRVQGPVEDEVLGSRPDWFLIRLVDVCSALWSTVLFLRGFINKVGLGENSSNSRIDGLYMCNLCKYKNENVMYICFSEAQLVSFGECPQTYSGIKSVFSVCAQSPTVQGLEPQAWCLQTGVTSQTLYDPTRPKRRLLQLQKEYLKTVRRNPSVKCLQQLFSKMSNSVCIFVPD